MFLKFLPEGQHPIPISEVYHEFMLLTVVAERTQQHLQKERNFQKLFYKLIKNKKGSIFWDIYYWIQKA